MGAETRVSPAKTAEIRAVEGDDGAKKLAGYAAVFDRLSEDLGGFRERIAPTAFNRTLSHGGDVVVTMNHDVNLLLGRTGASTARIGADERGVWYEVDLPDTAAGRDVWTLAERGDLAGSSFTFRTAKNGDDWERDDNGDRVRTLTEVQLLELGPVASPAYLDTTVAARSLAELEADEAANTKEDLSTENDAADEADTRTVCTVSPTRRLLRVVR